MQRECEYSKLINILQKSYGLQNVSLQFLREGGSEVYLAETSDGKQYLLKVIGTAFAETARQSVDVMYFIIIF